MDQPTQNQSDPGVARVVNIIYGVHIAALFVYLFIGETFLRKEPTERSDFLSGVFLAMAFVGSLIVIANFKTSPFLFKFFYKPAGLGSRPPLVQYAVILWAFCESIAIFGLVAVFLGGSTQIQIACTLMSLLCFWMASPKSIREQIERQKAEL